MVIHPTGDKLTDTRDLQDTWKHHQGGMARWCIVSDKTSSNKGRGHKDDNVAGRKEGAISKLKALFRGGKYTQQ